jgi:glycerophosphoryl diester phosphodiesterase
MTGIKIRLSRFSGLGTKLFDLTSGFKLDFKPAALLLYPHQVTTAVADIAAGRNRTLLLFRLTEWSEHQVRPLLAPAAVAPLGGDGSVVDLAAGYEDEVEIESLRILSDVTTQAHNQGLPVIAWIRLNESLYLDKPAAPYLEIPLAAAEEMGVDAVILPRSAVEKGTMQYRSAVARFIAEDHGMIVRDDR